MATKHKVDPRVQEDVSDASLFAEWKRLCLVNGCEEDDVDDTAGALRQLFPPSEYRAKLTLAIRRLSGGAWS